MNQYHYQENLVSLVTPGWNGRLFVHRLLDSIIAQTYRPLQYIYVDDGSTDGTAEIVKGYKDKFAVENIDFKYIRKKNAGLCEALMTGMEYVEGEYWSNPEYDDILFPDSVEKRVTFLKNHPDCAVVVADAWVVPEDNLQKRDQLISNKNPNRFDRNHFYQCLMSNTIFNAACYMVRMDRFDETHPNRVIIPYQYGSNQQILLPLYYFWNRGFIEKPLSVIVNRKDSLSKLNRTLAEEISHDIEYQTLLYTILDGIEMPDEDREMYKERVEINVQKDFLLFGERYHNEEVYRSAYNFLIAIKEIKPVINKRESPHSFMLRLKSLVCRIAPTWHKQRT